MMYRNRGGCGSERGVGDLEYRKLRTALCPLSHAVDHHGDVFMAVSSHTPTSVVSKNQHPGSAFRDSGSKVCRVHTVALPLGYRRGDSVLTVAVQRGPCADWQYDVGRFKITLLSQQRN